jgi:hypothetical protein
MVYNCSPLLLAASTDKLIEELALVLSVLPHYCCCVHCRSAGQLLLEPDKKRYATDPDEEAELTLKLPLTTTGMAAQSSAMAAADKKVSQRALHIPSILCFSY